ncbi:gliding motility-associated C-terminal domain-containing protein [Flavitalea sp. BT771]|uniref:T9SS type B sorting domain-containing protein n=1 Tax=Flavitalea sp. BT771 TaxID=3063329 RepID=UPI0026E406B7|nr:T9SS type B sorting domain-containing protein [Flavitalea sp. BT771]MDO6435219.1 gliding motility-associated C-terminal domain-containing protein [Flavitalea sp. BT771]MDV6224076.1 gliding motility-associated C-terminal domain-containing protein [Flavitalea sp. BT771]
MTAISRHILLIACLAVICASPTFAQYEFFATLNPSDLSLNRLAKIQGVTWITGNSAYDENHHRFFFQGNATGALPFDLFTVDATSGASISMPPLPSNFAKGNISGLQYDNVKDTLYAIYLDGTGAGYFSWIEPATGVVHTVKSIPLFSGFGGSTFDEKDHVYICLSGPTLYAIDASTGNVLYQSDLPAGVGLNQIVYNNSDGKLYGIDVSPALPAPQFDSISLATGTVHVIAALPPLSLPYIYAYAIDEASGKYLFVGEDPISAACINYYFYVVDIHTGAVLSKTLYPYAQNAGSITDENVIDYAFDQRTNTLYALNWHPPSSGGDPSIQITASDDPVCQGKMITFTATAGSTVVNPSYQWFVNRLNTGMTGTVFSRDDLAGGDTVYCVITDHSPCLANATDTSNRIVIQSKPNASVAIDATHTKVCTGDPLQFTAYPTNGGDHPHYQWQINGNYAGTDSDTLTSSTLADGDIVSCIMTGNLVCSLPVPSTNPITMIVHPRPEITMAENVTIARGKSIRLTPSVTGAITIYQWTPPAGLDNPDLADPVAAPLVTTDYQLQVTADNGCTASGKTTVNVSSAIQMPGAFTPNGDGRNDLFRIPPSSPQKIISFAVYNRWGQMIFFTTNSGSGWDGTFNGQQQPAGSYVWKIDYEDATGARRLVSGTVMLVR